MKKNVFFAARVTLEDENGMEKTYRIVGPDEIDFGDGYISIDSPMARAMRGKSVDDEITVRTKQYIREYQITNIKYDEQNSSR